MALLDDLVQPFERIDPAAVTELLRDAWGLAVTGLTLLDTERDDTFRVDDQAGGTVLAKVAHPLDGPELLDLQDAALAAAAALPVPRLVPTRDGASSVTLDGRIVRVLSWLPGSEAGVARMPLRAGGETLGRLSRALAPLEHPGADRILPWDLARVPRLSGYTSDERLLAAIARFAADVSPVLAAAPQQIVHGDFHPGNVLVDDSGAISGVVDFGDISRTARVCDVGVALGYLIPEDAPGDAVRAEFLAGFESVVPLTHAERTLIPGLVVGRQIQRIVINEELGRRTGRFASAPRLWRLFDRALEDWA
jgi:Ser/Thr protein kinase RdoA (MazF antagonist)